MLLHLELAVKHDPELGTAWVRRLKNGAWHPSPFAFALSFVMAGVPRFESQVQDALLKLFKQTQADQVQCAATRWLPSEAADWLPTAASADEVQAALLACARNCGRGQSPIVQPLFGLAMDLMSKGKGGQQAALEASKSTADLGIRVLTELFAAHKSCRKDILATCTNRLIGSDEASALPFLRLIAKLVREHPAAVEAHVQQVRVALENVALLPEGAAMGLLLALWPLCRERRDVGDFVIVLLRKAMFGRELPARLLAARGFLFLIVEELKAAAQGAGPALADAGPSCSQAVPALSQLDGLAGGSCGATLLHELLGFLRRCLTQQVEVRRVVYQGLPSLLTVDPDAAEAMAELLLPHFSMFCEADASLSPPLKLEACAHLTQDGSVRIVESLPHLLACVRIVVQACSPGGASDTPGGGSTSLEASIDNDTSAGCDEATAGAALRRLFVSVCSRLRTCSIEDFCFDQSTCFAVGEGQGELNQATASMLLGCYEVAMEERVDAISALASDSGALSAQEATERLEGLAGQLLELFQHHRRLSNLAAEGARAGGRTSKGDGLTQAVGGGRKGAAGSKTSRASSEKRVPVLSIPCLARLLTSIVDDGLVPGGCSTSTGEQSAHIQLARDASFQTFVMTACMSVLHAQNAATGNNLTPAVLASSGGGAVDPAVRSLFALPDLPTLAKPLFEAVKMTVLACARQRVPGGAGGKKEKDPSEALMVSAIGCLGQLLAVGGGSLGGLAELLGHLPAARGTAVVDATPEAVIAARLPHFRQLFEAALEGGCVKEVESLCTCIHTLVSVLPPAQASEVAQWVEAACFRVPTVFAQSPSAARALISLYLRCAAAAGTAAAGSQDDLAALAKLGDQLAETINAHADQETATLNFSASESLPLLSAKTANAIMLAGVAHADAAMASIEWALQRLRDTANLSPADGALEDGSALARMEHRASWEDACFMRLQGLITAAAALSHPKLQGPPMEAIGKCLTRVYKLLGVAAKTQLAGKGHAQTAPGRTFQDLAAAVNATLTPQVYTFVTDVETAGTNAAGVAAAAAADPAELSAENEDANEPKAAGRKVKNKRAATVDKALKESKLIPNLVYQIEEYERFIIKVSKAGRLNLMGNAKRATNRDFRLVSAVPKRPRTEDDGDAAAGEAGEEAADDGAEAEGNGPKEEDDGDNDDDDGMYDDDEEDNGGFYDE